MPGHPLEGNSLRRLREAKDLTCIFAWQEAFGDEEEEVQRGCEDQKGKDQRGKPMMQNIGKAYFIYL